MSFQIVTDSSANLPAEVLRRYGIPFVPFHYYVGDRHVLCPASDEYDGEAFFQLLREKANVTTSLVNPEQYREMFEPYLKEGVDILYVGMSSGISGSYQSSVIAAAELKERYPARTIRVVDTLSASLGEGLLVLRAVEMQQAGKPIDEIADTILRERMQMMQIFTVGELMHLRRTGRVSGVTAAIGSALHVKPLLKGDVNGRIVVAGNAIGRKRSLKALADYYAEYQVNAASQTIGIAHCGCAKEAYYLAGLLREAAAPQDILTVCYEPVTGSHVGPDTVALFFMGKGR